MALVPLTEAQRHILTRCPRLDAVKVPLRSARGLVTTSPIHAAESVPPFDNTAMDGFAVRSIDVEQAPVDLDVVATIAAGQAPEFELQPGQAARIMTGAPVPEGADAIVMVELTESLAGDRVRITASAPAGQHIRRAGDDLHAGDCVFISGTTLGPAHIGVLANVGLTEVEVYKRPRVGVLSTGDELVEAPAALGPGQIRDSNRVALLAALETLGCEAVDLGLFPDDVEAIEAGVRDAATTCDALITSGGVSVGDFDHMKAVLDNLGEMRWMQVAIKPAKPLAFGQIGDADTPVFGLPGNPVSSLVSFELFARPALRNMMGQDRLGRPTVRAVVNDGLPRKPGDGKIHFYRVQCRQTQDGFEAKLAGGQGSHQLTALAHADGLAVVHDGPGIAPGETVPVMLLDNRWAIDHIPPVA